MLSPSKERTQHTYFLLALAQLFLMRVKSIPNDVCTRIWVRWSFDVGRQDGKAGILIWYKPNVRAVQANGPKLGECLDHWVNCWNRKMVCLALHTNRVDKIGCVGDRLEPSTWSGRQKEQGCENGVSSLRKVSEDGKKSFGIEMTNHSSATVRFPSIRMNKNN